VFSNKDARDMDVISAVGGFVTAEVWCVGFADDEAIFWPAVTDDGN